MKDNRILNAMRFFSKDGIEIKANSLVTDVEKQEVFNVVDPMAQGGNGIRPLSISLSKTDSTVDGSGGEQFILSVMWEDTWTQVINIVTESESVENDYIDLVEKLKAISSDVENNNTEGAKSLLLEFLKDTKKIEGKYSIQPTLSESEEHMINGINNPIEAHTLIELAKCGHVDVIPTILKKEGWTDETIESYMTQFKMYVKPEVK